MYRYILPHVMVHVIFDLVLAKGIEPRGHGLPAPWCHSQANWHFEGFWPAENAVDHLGSV